MIQFDEDWHASHDCGLNYKGSAPNMEKAGSVSIFQRSIEKNGLRYTTFYGDGDSKSFNAVENIYGDDYPVIKQECIGHYQKRVGNRLRKLRKEKKLGGKKRLTNKNIDTLQNYFGIGMIWERLPKTKYVGFEKLKLGVYDAIANFNYGKKASIDMREMNLVPGKYMRLMCDTENKKRKSLSLEGI